MGANDGAAGAEARTKRHRLQRFERSAKMNELFVQ
jgi:hypothetical protein